jgi:O-antigen/teichoic acid export membrane protein
LLVYYLNKLFKLKRPLKSADRDLKGIMTFAIPDWIAGIMDTFRLNIQDLLIGSLHSIAGVGIFTVADQLNVIGHDFYTSINTAAKPYIAELHDRGERAELARLYQTTTKWSLTVNLPFFLTLVLFPLPILSIFGKSFESGTLALIIMAVASLVDVGTGMCGAVLNMTGYTGLKLANNIVTLILSLAINVILIPRWGIVGAAVSTLVVTAVLNSIRIVQVYVLVKILPYNISFVKPVVAALATFLGVYFLSQRFPIEAGFKGLFALAAHLAVLFTVFVAVVWSLGLSNDDRILLRRVSNRAIGLFSRK